MTDNTVPQGTLKEKIRLLLAAHKGYTLAAAAAVILAAVLLIAALTAKETLLTGILLDYHRDAPEEAYYALNQGFAEEKGLDPRLWEVRLAKNLAYSGNNIDPTFHDNFTAIDKLSDYISGGMLDFLLAEAETLESLAYSGFFTDLREILTSQQLESWAPYIRYMDMAVIDRLEQMALSKEYPEDFALPDPGKPEEMEAPVPVFIDVTGIPGTEQIWPGSKVYYAVALNTQHPTIVKDYAEYLLG